MSTIGQDMTPRERELGAIIRAYNDVTERLKESHEQLRDQVQRLRAEVARKNRQLRRRERLAALGEMAAGVAHEIRNPLGGIQMFASLLRRDLADQPEALRLVERINKGVNTLESIVSNILAFSRPAEAQPGAVCLKALARETVELVAVKAAAAGVRVEIGDSVNRVELVTDGRLLQRALLNLLLNAIDAAGRADSAAGKVVIASRSSSGERVTISVADNGAGIPAGLMDRIFNPFFTTKSSGTGLGLSIVHQIVESLGGSVQAANRGGGGAVFSIALPRRWGETEHRGSSEEKGNLEEGRDRETNGEVQVARNTGRRAAARSSEQEVA